MPSNLESLTHQASLMVWLLGAMGGVSLSAFAADSTAVPSAKWEADIAAFERADRIQKPPTNGVVFVGSSSIRMWASLSNDFAGVPVVKRGFGGSQMNDTLHFADRIILPYRPRLVVVYAGDNDLAAGRTPEAVFADFQALVSLIHRSLPDTRVAFIAIKPSIARWKMVEKIKAANALVEDWCRTNPRLGYIDIFTPMLGEDGQPRPELFLRDGLHLNPEGYRVWAGKVRPVL